LAQAILAQGKRRPPHPDRVMLQQVRWPRLARRTASVVVAAAAFLCHAPPFAAATLAESASGEVASDDVLASSLESLSSMLDDIADETVGEGEPAPRPIRMCKPVMAGDIVIASREIFAPGVATVPKLTPGRVLRVGQRARVVFRIASTGRETTVDVFPMDVCLQEDLGSLLERERRFQLKGPGPGGYSVGLQVVAAKDIKIGGVAHAPKGTKGTVASFPPSGGRITVAFEPDPRGSRRVRINVRPSEIEVDSEEM